MQAAPTAVTAWEQVPWATVKSVVTRLQALIYTASVENKIEEVHALQDRLLCNAHAKLLAVRRATDLNQGEPIGCNAPLPGMERVYLASRLLLSDRGMPFKVTRRKRLGDSMEAVVRDRAKQVLTKLALEPQWEARFESGVFGFRPNRNCRDAVEAITLSLKGKPKYVLVVNSCHLFQEMDHRALLSKLRQSLPALSRQVEAWLNNGIMALRWINPGMPRHCDYGIITPLLANIALHGMETALKEWAAKTFPDEPAPLLIRYCEQFVVLNKSAPFIAEATAFLRQWLLDAGIRLDPDRYYIADTRSGFYFLGFKFMHVWKKGKGIYIKTVVKASKDSCKLLLAELKTDIVNCKGKSCHELISTMAPRIERFGHYFKYSQTHHIFRKMDHLITKKLRPWVFRRRRYVGRWKAKKLFYPSDRIYTYQGKEHQSEWVLADDGDEFQKRVFLPQLRWIRRDAPPLPKSVEDIKINLDNSLLETSRRVPEVDTLIQLWSKTNLLKLSDHELEDFSQVLKVGNRDLWKALTDQDDGSHLYLYENPVFLKMKEDISKKLKFLFQ